MEELSDDTWRPIDAEILAGRMIEAIKVYRQTTGAGLKDAKDAVESRGQVITNALYGSAGVPTTDVAGLSESSAIDWDAMDALIFAGRKIHAIKLYRAASGLGLKESKDEIDARESQLRASSPERFTAVAKTGCMSMILFFAGITSMIFLFK